MKCVKLETGKVVRVTNEKAEQLTKQPSRTRYASKQEWKASGRQR